MNPANNLDAADGQPSSGLGIDDVLFTVFRHKWLLLAFIGLGIVGAAAVRLVRPPLYVSKAKLMVPYVVETKVINPANPGTQINQDVNQSIINSEVEILTSLDVAEQIAETVGPEKILAERGGGNDRKAAAGVICSGLEVEIPPRTSILVVSFKHPEASVVQPVLRALMDAYMQKHVEVHQGGGMLTGYYSKQRDELRSRLAETENQIKKLKTEAKVLFVDETKQAYQNQVMKWQEELLAAEGDLEQRKMVLANLAPGAVAAAGTNGPDASIPADKLEAYNLVNKELKNFRERERELFQQGYKEAYPLVERVRSQIEELTKQKADLEREFPSLARLGAATTPGGISSGGIDIASELVEIKKLSAKVMALGNLLSNVQAEASQVMDVAPQIARLELQREWDETNYLFLTGLQQARVGESMAQGKVMNISVLEKPTPPYRDSKKLKKMMLMVLGGCIGLGFGLAFLVDFVLDRTVRRSVDVARYLRLPVFLAIPDTSWAGRLALPWAKNGHDKVNAPITSSPEEGNGDTFGVVPWTTTPGLQTFIDGLRERLITYFETRHLNLKKPKLVAVTGCDKGAGVTTLASGLAAALSKIGDGNVLLVDMNSDQGSAHSFHQGRLGCGLSDVLEPEGRAEAQVQENLFVASIDDGSNNDKLVKVMPSRLTRLMPKLKASDYDYIIFDMPPVSPTSATPRLASYMDLVLLVLESGKTGQQAAARAGTLMRETRANVAAVLNKCRQHVPARLSQEW